MKKLICVLLMIMMVSFTGCSPKESAAEIYKKAMDNYNTYDSVTMSVDMMMKWNNYGIELDVPTKMEFEMVDMQNTDIPQMHMDIVTQMAAIDKHDSTEVWVKDNNSYVINNGIRRIKPYDPTIGSDIYNLNLDGSIEGGTVEDDGTNKVLTLEISEDAYPKILDDVFSTTGLDDLGVPIDDMDISIDDVTVVVDEDYNFVSTKIKIALRFDQNGEVKVDTDVTIKYTNINKTTFDYPDLDSFANNSTVDVLAGFNGEGKVCTADFGSDFAGTAYSILHTDSDNVIQKAEVIFTVDVSAFNDETKERFKETMDSQFEEKYSGSGVDISSSIEGDMYIMTVSYTDMAAWGDWVGSENPGDYQDLDYNVKALEATGFTCE